MGYCENCNHCHINASDDSRIYCELGHRAIMCGSCKEYEKRPDGLELQLVYDWR